MTITYTNDPAFAQVAANFAACDATRKQAKLPKAGFGDCWENACPLYEKCAARKKFAPKKG